MTVVYRVLILGISLLLIGCAKWGPYKKTVREVTLYADVQQGGIDKIVSTGTICRIDARLSMGKVYGFHKTECKNGQTGYLMIGGDRDEEAFETVR